MPNNFCTVVGIMLPYHRQKTFHCFRSVNSRKNEEDMRKKVVVITGANDGLGKMTALQMAKRGANVIMACRDMEKGERAREEIKAQVPDAQLMMVHLDLGDLSSVRDCVSEIETLVPYINILVNNAGIMEMSGVYKETLDGFEMNMGINHLGHFLFTLLLLDYLKKGVPSRIVCVSSLMHKNHRLNLDDLMSKNLKDWGYHNMIPYANSKLAIILFAKELGRRLENTGVNTYALCPGAVATSLMTETKSSYKECCGVGCIMKSCMTISVEKGVETTLYCSCSKKCAHETGLLYHFGRRWNTTKAVRQMRQSTITRLWELSEELVHFNGKDTASQQLLQYSQENKDGGDSNPTTSSE